jgi:DNA replication and repair protein RecF
MPVQSVSLDRFRNLQPVTLEWSPELNLITGPNAAGKTSVLESLYVLARARSFRTRFLHKAIQRGADSFQIVAKVLSGTGRTLPVGVWQQQKQLTARIDGKPVQRLSDLAAWFPVQWIGGNLHRLMEEGPAQRRQFLDWGLFHVKQGYSPAWQRYQRLLKQRNAALRARRSALEVKAWDQELANAGNELNAFRTAYVAELSAAGGPFLARLLEKRINLEMSYRSGWRSGLSFQEALAVSLDTDREQGFTRIGPHRADLELFCEGLPLAEQLSRGQQKLVVIGLQVLQAKLLRDSVGNSSLFLIDDLGAELDRANQFRVMGVLGDLRAQVFATAIEPPDMPGWDPDRVKRFHVKHGRVSSEVI